MNSRVTISPITVKQIKYASNMAYRRPHLRRQTKLQDGAKEDTYFFVKTSDQCQRLGCQMNPKIGYEEKALFFALISSNFDDFSRQMKSKTVVKRLILISLSSII